MKKLVKLQRLLAVTLSLALMLGFASVPVHAATDAANTATFISKLANPYFVIPFDYDKEWTVEAVEWEVEDYITDKLYDNNYYDAYIDSIKWTNPPATLKSAMASKSCSFKIVLEGYDDSTKTITKNFHVQITSDANFAKVTITNATKPYLEVDFWDNRAYTIEEVEYYVAEYWEDYLWDRNIYCEVTAQWLSPPASIKGAIAAKDYKFALTLDGYDYSYNKIASKLAKVRILND